MKYVRSNDNDYLPAISKPLNPVISYRTQRRNMGNMPDSYQRKSYMVFGRYDSDLLEDYGHTTMGFFKMPKIKVTINVKKLINSIGKAFQTVVDLVKETVAAATKVVKAIVPPALHKYIDIIVNPIPLITNPTATIAKLIDPRPLIKMITNPVATIKYIIDPKPKIAALEYTYKNVLRPVYREIANATAELALKPVNNVLDETVYKVLPSSLANKLEKLTDLPEQAARGKLTSEVLREATMAYVGIITLPTAVGGYLGNGIVNWAKKDKILGTVINGLDKYSGGLITSAQNLANSGQEVYYERDIDWKRKILDGVKVYLAVTGATAFAQSMAANYVGHQTGLDKTPIGRDVLTASKVYLAGSWSAEDSAFNFTSEAAAKAGTSVLSDTAKREIIIEAAKKGIIDKKTLEDMVHYGTALYGAKNPDGTFSSDQMVEISKDGVYQEFIREEVKKRTGLDLSMKDLADIYGYAMNPNEILENVNAAANKAVNDKDQWDKNIDKAYNKAIEDYKDFDLAKFVEQEMPRMEQNVKDELSRYASGHVDNFIKWAVGKLGPEAAKNPKNFTPELLVEYETTVLDLTGSPVPKKRGMSPVALVAGVALLGGAAYLVMED